MVFLPEEAVKLVEEKFGWKLFYTVSSIIFTGSPRLSIEILNLQFSCQFTLSSILLPPNRIMQTLHIYDFWGSVKTCYHVNHVKLFCYTYIQMYYTLHVYIIHCSLHLQHFIDYTHFPFGIIVFYTQITTTGRNCPFLTTSFRLLFDSLEYHFN